MPFYDLQCKNCGSEFNILASMSDRENKKINCPKCGSNELETVFKNVNVIKSKNMNAGCAKGCCSCPHH